MKTEDLLKKLKANTKTNYVRKADHKKLLNEVKKLKKAVAKLQKCCEKASPEQDVAPPEPKPAKPAAKKTPVKTRSTGKDDLKQIAGIGPVLEQKLNKLGIKTIAQIAAWKPSDIEKTSVHLNFKGRIEREGWVEQAATLIKA